MILRSLTSRLCLLISLITPTFVAADAALDAARIDRLEGRTPAALQRLDTLVGQHPTNIAYRFERGVALADLGRCAQARTAFQEARTLAPNTPSVDQAINAALSDLCPVRANSWERSIDTRFIADGNYNNATSAESIFLGPFEFALNESARAQERYGIDTNARFGYSIGLTERLAIVPSLGMGLTILNDRDDSRIRLSPGVALDWAGRGWTARVGPIVRLEGNQDGLISHAYGIDGRVFKVLTPRDAVEFNASWAQVEHTNDLDTGQRLRGDIAWIRHLDDRSTLRLSLAYGQAERTPSFRSDRDTRVSVAYARRVNDAVAFDALASIGRIRADAPQPMFGVTRQDTILGLSLGVTFLGIDTPFGHPVVGFSHTRSRSNIVLNDYAKNAVFLGFSTRF